MKVTNFIPLGMIVVIAATYGQINSTYDGLLTFLVAALLVLGSITALVCMFLPWMVSNTYDEKLAHEGSYDSFKKLYRGWRLVVTILSMATFAGAFVYLEWGGFLGWYLVNQTIVTACLVITRAMVIKKDKEFGVEPNEVEVDI